jgi:ribose transport system permease protein
VKPLLKSKSLNKKKFKFSNSLGILVVIILFALLIQTRSAEFISRDNFITLMRNSSIIIIVGFGQMVVMAGSGLNVAIGSIGGLAAVLVGAFVQRVGLHWGLAVVIAILLGACCGALNGILITRLGSTGEISWLVTLATMSIFAGITLTITKANPFYNLPEGFTWIGSYNVGGVIPVMFIIAVVFAVLIWFIFKHSSFGHQVLAVGANQRAATLSGIHVTSVIILKHIISATLAASAGILFSTRLGSIHSDIGLDWMLFSFAAPLIGGARMEGGRVNVFGAFLGGILLAMVSNAVVHLKVNVYIVEFLQGVIILLAVGLDRIRAIREEHRDRMERAKI